MRFPVFLSYNRLRQGNGAAISFPERRLTRRSADDRVIAVIEAPPGSRVRRKRDEHGPDQLLVPVSTSLWARWFGPRVAIPAKYVIGTARLGIHGLRLVEVAHPESRTCELSS
ncbi:MAG: hypothetical protein IRY99_21900 [Isosphaeraceae bacterium]|nr:hypothetical protein [Isosphaeraceae bacterium]